MPLQVIRLHNKLESLVPGFPSDIYGVWCFQPVSTITNLRPQELCMYLVFTDVDPFGRWQSTPPSIQRYGRLRCMQFCPTFDSLPRAMVRGV